MAEPEQVARGWVRRRVRDIAAVTLIGAGTIGLNAAAFLWDPLAGAAAVSVTAVAAGVACGLE